MFLIQVLRVFHNLFRILNQLVVGCKICDPLSPFDSGTALMCQYNFIFVFHFYFSAPNLQLYSVHDGYSGFVHFHRV